MQGVRQVLAISFFTTLLVACEPPHDATGKELFEHYCSKCHNDSGKGQFLKGVPPNVGTWLATSQIVVLLKHGKANYSDMPAIEGLTEEQALLIASYLKYELPRVPNESD